LALRDLQPSSNSNILSFPPQDAKRIKLVSSPFAKGRKWRAIEAFPDQEGYYPKEVIIQLDQESFLRVGIANGVNSKIKLEDAKELVRYGYTERFGEFAGEIKSDALRKPIEAKDERTFVAYVGDNTHSEKPIGTFTATVIETDSYMSLQKITGLKLITNIRELLEDYNGGEIHTLVEYGSLSFIDPYRKNAVGFPKKGTMEALNTMTYLTCQWIRHAFKNIDLNGNIYFFAILQEAVANTIIGKYRIPFVKVSNRDQLKLNNADYNDYFDKTAAYWNGTGPLQVSLYACRFDQFEKQVNINIDLIKNGANEQ